MSAANLDLGGLAAGSGDVPYPHPAGTLAGQAELAPILQAGHPSPDPGSGILLDSPTLRVDPNTTTSAFAGVGSLFTDDDPSDLFGVLCTATPIDKWHILTAGHCLDITDGDGKSDVLPENALFVLNYGSDFSHIIPASAIAMHPDYDGTASVSLNDDLAILTLSDPIPDGVPIYPLANPGWLGFAELIMAGYGESGDGVNGFFVDPQFNTKRSGANLLEYAELDDEGSPAVEIIAWDFEYEGDPGRFDIFGIPFAFENRRETLLGAGDSGSPSFMQNPDDPSDSNLYLASVNSFGFSIPGVPDHDQADKFGAGSGGIWLNSHYQRWVHQTVPEASPRFAEILLGAAALVVTSRICQPRRQNSGHRQRRGVLQHES